MRSVCWPQPCAAVAQASVVNLAQDARIVAKKKESRIADDPILNLHQLMMNLPWTLRVGAVGMR